MEHFIGIDAGGWLDKCVVLVVTVAVTLVVQRVVVRLMHKALDVSELPSASLFINIGRALIWVLALLSVLRPVFGVDPAGFVAALGVVSLAISLGMQDTISNIIGGISLMLSKSVQPGDYISVGDVTGNLTINGDSAVVTVANAAEVELANGTLTVKDITGDLTLTKGSLNLNGAAKIAASSVTSDVTVNLGASAVLTVDASSNAVDISGMKLTAQLGAQVKAVDGSSNGITVAANLFYSAKDTAVSSNKLTDGKTYTYVNTITASGNSDGCGFLQEA